MALNNQIISSVAANLVANAGGGITGANIANITSNLQTFISNNGTDIKSVSIRSSTDANFTANYTLTLPVNDGSSGQVLTTDGSGVLSWATGSSGSSNTISDGNSNVVVNPNANVTISSAGNANIVVVTGTGANVTGTLNASGNANVGNLGTATAIITTGNITTVNTGLVQNGNSNVAITSNANITITANSNTVATVTSSGDGNLQTTGVNIAGYINATGNINSANFVGKLANGNSNIAIAANAAINISSNGIANAVTVNSTSSSTLLTVGTEIVGASTVTDDSVNDVTIDFGIAAGDVNVIGDYPSGGSGYSARYGSSQAKALGALTTVGAYNMGTGDWTLEGWYYLYSGAVNAGNAKPWSTTGNLSNVNSSITALSLWDSTGFRANQPGFVVGSEVYSCFTSNTVSRTTWFHAAWVRNGTSFAMYLNGNVVTVANTTGGDSRTSVTLAGTEVFDFGSASAPSVSLPGYASETYKVRLSNTALYTANFTPSASYGNTASTVFLLNANIEATSIAGNISAGNISLSNTANLQGNVVMSGANVSLGAVGNLHITGGSNGQVLTTNGSGNLSWTTVSSGSSNTISDGNSNVVVNPNANVTISSAGNANIVVVTGTGANITGTLNASGNANTGNLGTATAIITTGNITTVNTGLVQNGNSNIAITSNANVTITANSNAVVAITSSGDGNLATTGGNVTGYWNVSGNINSANFTGVFANGNSNVSIPAANGNVNISAVGNANIVVVTGTGTTVNGNITTTGQITSNRAGNLSDGGGQLYLNGAGNNRIDFNTNGTGAPTFTTRSAGTKIALYPSLGASAGDYALGVDAGVLWSSLPASDAGQFFKWYGGTTEVANLSGTGVFQVVGNANTGNLGTATAIITTGNITTVNTGLVQNGNSNVAITANANVTITANSNAVVAITSSGDGNAQTTGGNVTGYWNVSGNVIAGNLVGKLANGNSNIAIAANSNVTVSSAGNASVVTVTGSNVITGAGVGFILTSNNGTDVRQVQLKTSTDANFSANYALTLPVNDGNSGQVLTTDGSGILTWANAGSGSSSNTISDGNSNVVVNPNSTINFGVAGNANVIIVTSVGANITGNANISGNANIGNIGTSTALITTGNISTINTSLIQNGNSNIAFTPNANITITTNSNAVVTVTSSGDGNLATTGVNVAGYINATGNINSANFVGVFANGNSNVSIPAANGNVNISAVGNANVLVVTGTGANIAGNANVTGNLSANNFSTTGAAGNITGANVVAANTFKASSGVVVVSNNGTSLQQITIQGSTNAGFTSNYSLTLPVDDGTSGQVLSTDGSGILSWSSVSATSITNGNSNVSIPTANGNVTISAVGNANVVVVTGTGANVAGTLDVTGNANLGNLGTATAVITTGNITTVNTGVVQNGNSNVTIAANANVIITAKSNTTMVISDTSANITGIANVTGNLIAGGILSVTGTGVSSIAGNVDMNGKWVTNIGYAVANSDAASKQYVDTLVSTGISYHTPVNAATTTTLATTTGGTTAYNQPNGAGNGIGAYISTTGTFDVIDGVTINGSTSVRILVKDEANASWNGVYTYTNATAITRSTDADEYGVGSTQLIGLNDYFFTEAGTINKGIAYIVSGPVGTITFGTSNITFSIFSSSQVYTAGTGINIVGTVISANASQTQITAVGTLANLSVTGNTTSGNFIGTFANGNSNVNIPAANGNVNISAIGNANILVVTGTGVNVAGTLNATGNANVGNLGANIANITTANVTNAIVTTGNITTINSGLLQNGNSNIVITSNANITLTAKSNATMVISDTGANVTGTANVSGNANVGNLGTTTAIITTGNITTVNTGLVQNGNSNVTITANGNIALTAISNNVMELSGTVIGVTASIVPTANVTYDIGNSTRFIMDAYISNIYGANLANSTVDGTNPVGFRNVPVLSQDANSTTVLADAGKLILHPSTDANPRTFTIAANSSVSYPIGTVLTFINMTSNVVTIAIATDTMYLAGNGATGSRSLAQYGMATAVKMENTSWLINGTGLT